MASVRKRGNSYQVTVSNGRRADGTQILETDTFTPEPGMPPKQEKKALEQFVMDFERDVKSGQNVKGRRMTLDELSELFLKDNEPTGNPDDDIMSITTWASYKNCLRLRIVPRLGHLKICSIIPKNLKDYSKDLRQDGARIDGKPGGLSESTITRDCAIVSSLLSYAVGEGLLTINPFIYAGKQSKGHRPKKEYKVKYLTIEQTQAFLWALDYSTAYVDGKIIQKKTKTNKSRTPVIPPVVTGILKLWKAEQMRQSMERGTYWQGYHGKEFDKNFIFTQENGIQMHPSSPSHQFKRIIELYNKYVAEDCSHMIPLDITPHDLRHTAASILIANNMDPRSVAGVLGHSNATTTLNIYAYFFRSKNEEAANIMESVLIKAN
uniref:tyrosine-type recombinase/integrase n=2 Tax=Enterocloster clostridioformis TaxID=1531 RepID=UPI001C3D26B5|nr:tyrosine-type recombinase/integrase [Enterocloster clostridioformis]